MYAIERYTQLTEHQQTVLRRFTWALAGGHWTALWSWVRGTSAGLLDLATVIEAHGMRAMRSAGTRTVPFAAIRGSDGRRHDFDAAFHPRQTHTRDRWLRVARAHLRGIELAPVDLIQVGDVYFVRDGHHRISVAHAFGQAAIDAVVTTWETDTPLTDAVATTRRWPRALGWAGRWCRRRRQRDAGTERRMWDAADACHACAA